MVNRNNEQAASIARQVCGGAPARCWGWKAKIYNAAYEAADAALSTTPAKGGETTAEEFLKAAIDSAPEPLRRLGEFLTEVLDEDQWPTADRMLLALATASTTPAGNDELVEAAKAIAETHRLKIKLCTKAAYPEVHDEIAAALDRLRTAITNASEVGS